MFEANHQSEPGVQGAKRGRYRKANPWELLEKIVEEDPPGKTMPTKDELDSYRKTFRERVGVEDDDGYLSAIANYFLDNALRGIFDKRVNGHNPEAKAKAKAVEKTTEKKVKATVEEHIHRKAQLVLLDLIMPNGKALAECTGSDCKHFTGWCGKLAKLVPAKSKVGEVLSEQEVRKQWRESK